MKFGAQNPSVSKVLGLSGLSNWFVLACQMQIDIRMFGEKYFLDVESPKLVSKSL